jgi:hypothetical protein
MRQRLAAKANNSFENNAEKLPIIGEFFVYMPYWLIFAEYSFLS